MTLDIQDLLDHLDLLALLAQDWVLDLAQDSDFMVGSAKSQSACSWA